MQWYADAPHADLPPLQWSLINEEGNINLMAYQELISPAIKYLKFGPIEEVLYNIYVSRRTYVYPLVLS